MADSTNQTTDAKPLDREWLAKAGAEDEEVEEVGWKSGWDPNRAGPANPPSSDVQVDDTVYMPFDDGTGVRRTPFTVLQIGDRVDGEFTYRLRNQNTGAIYGSGEGDWVKRGLIKKENEG
ncbi:hypothetical protein PRZ48_002110 [Zasmidium cellare]|uniref:Head-to-tail stopper n=1 Tax=Zasmidium cellare TaxID=395010 RepID=A0ABR0F3V0_ZASCE|nr:hypothetical protein PRZ48_002110 [Zasmidium cellare]